MIYVVGIGSGGHDEITPKALDALMSCDVILGYAKYIDMIRGLLPNKKFLCYSMRQERDRCLDALKFSRDGLTVGLVSGGDSGVYGMAGLMLEIAAGTGEEVRVIAGLTAANACAAILGAPLMNDYATISLSDLMTPWDIIANRLKCACLGDFVICLYNPASNNRPDHFKRACEIMLGYKSPNTPAGYVRNAGRNEEVSGVMPLGEIKECRLIDMSCTVIVGNSKSCILDGKIITPRGYGHKYSIR